MPVCRFVFAVFAVVALCAGEVRAAETLRIDVKNLDLSRIERRDVTLARNGDALQVTSGCEYAWPGITLKAPGGRWDLSKFQYLTLDVKNCGSGAVEVSCRVDNPGGDGTKNCVTESVDLLPGASDTLRVPLPRKMPDAVRKKLFGMRGFPGCMLAGSDFDPANVTQLIVFVNQPTEKHCFEIGNFRAGGVAPEIPPLQEDKLFPMIDAYGQYMHKDWPGKIKSADALAAQKQKEKAELAANSGPDDWDQYGGWKAGPQLRATGYFRTEKYNGKWWLVDPEGRLFWSHGIDCVQHHNATTPITDRKHWFTDLPKSDSPFARFYGSGNWAPHNYYEGKRYETYDFTAANLFRKYGGDWAKECNALTHRRLRSWALNTIGNWSDGTICHMQKTPYVSTFGIYARQLEGSSGYWGKFQDVFSPEFEAAVLKIVAGQKSRASSDPWCIGYFIDNELGWGDDVSLAVATLTSPAKQPAKKVFVADLQKKYETIERLNKVWGSKYASWDALLQSTAAPDKVKAREDLTAFYTKTAERYFEACRNAVKEISPHYLYLGCRFAGANNRALLAAAKFCDVVSFNRYQRTLAGLNLPEGADRPILIGEFHFGALDRGMFHTGLVPTDSQADRANAYRGYVRSALSNPQIVGTHWFQYGDQATTGRGDGENYQIGFVDVCDTPYAETVEACREVGRTMYQFRDTK